MTMNSSGPISLGGSIVGQSIALEINRSATSQTSLNEPNVRTLAEQLSGDVIMPIDFYGKSFVIIPNGNFNEGPDGFLYWDLFAMRVNMNGKSIVAGYPTPAYTTTNNNYNSESITRTISRSVFLGSSYYCNLYIRGNLDPTGATAFGPYIVSKNPVNLLENDTISFDYRLDSNGDAYAAYFYMVNVNTGNIITFINRTGTNSSSDVGWTSYQITLGSGQSGSYKLVFIGGSYDSTYGSAIGANVQVKNIKAIRP